MDEETMELRHKFARWILAGMAGFLVSHIVESIYDAHYKRHQEDAGEITES